MVSSNDGFVIAEEDLKLRGPGDINGIQQSGYFTLGIADPINDKEIMEMARFPEDAKSFFEELGVPLKTERGKRVFPVSDKAQDIVDALARGCRDNGVKIIYEKVKALSVSDGSAVGVKTEKGEYEADAVIVATGGMSYKQTGSDGDGYRFAKQLGMNVTDLVPSLVPIVSSSKVCARMQGLSLKNVALRIVNKANGKKIYININR